MLLRIALFCALIISAFDVKAVASDETKKNPGAPLFNLSSLDRKPAPLFQVGPEYPADLLKSGKNGVVQIEFIIETDGTVSHLLALKATDPAFAKAAIAAARQWKFETPLKNGKPVRTRVTLPINFNH